MVPSFGTSVLSFKGRVVLLACFVVSMLSFLTFTSGATPADLLMASIAPDPV